MLLTLRLPPVRTTFTKRRVYVSLFLARPLLSEMSVSRILSRGVGPDREEMLHKVANGWRILEGRTESSSSPASRPWGSET